MTRYLLDTNHVSAALKRNRPLLDRMNAATDADFDLREALHDYRRWPFNSSAAMEFGKIKAELRRLGRPIQDVDVQIAAIARTKKLIVLSDDAGFRFIPGLSTENWLR